jgi:hypothetical protein
MNEFDSGIDDTNEFGDNMTVRDKKSRWKTLLLAPWQ